MFVYITSSVLNITFNSIGSEDCALTHPSIPAIAEPADSQL